MRSSKTFKALIAISILGLLTGTATSASAASKQITCYKGTVAKKFTATKCPAGYTAKPTKAAPATKGASYTFDGKYSVKVTFVWGDTDVRATSVTGTGTGSLNDLTELSGTGYSAPANQCDLFSGKGTLKGSSGTLDVEFDSSSQGCAADDSAPTTIAIKASATVKGGTGKFAGATGSFKVTGSIPVKSTKSGSTEVANGTLSISGTVTTK